MSEIEDALSGKGSEIDTALGTKKSDETGIISRGVRDTGVSLAKGVVDTGQTLYGLTNVASGGAIDKASGAISEMASRAANTIGDKLTGGDVGERYGAVNEPLSKNFEQAGSALAEGYSPETKAAFEKVNKTEGFVPTVVEAVKNPSVIYNSAVESAPVMAGMMGVVRAGAVAAGERAAVRAAASGASKAEQEAARAAAITEHSTGKAGVATQAGVDFLTSGSQQAQQARTDVLGMDQKTLETSPTYQQLVKGGMTPDQARLELADQAERTAFGVAGTLSAMASPIGANVEGKAATAGLRKTATERVLGIPLPKSAVGKAVASTAQEFVQEGLQSAGEQIGTNVGEQVANPALDTMNQVGNQAGMGAVTGAAMGGAMHVVGEVGEHGTIDHRVALPGDLPHIQAEAGPISAAARTAIDSGASAIEQTKSLSADAEENQQRAAKGEFGPEKEAAALAAIERQRDQDVAAMRDFTPEKAPPSSEASPSQLDFLLNNRMPAEQDKEQPRGPFPFATREAAEKHAAQEAKLTGEEHVVVPHPQFSDRFAAMPSSEVAKASTESSAADGRAPTDLEQRAHEAAASPLNERQEPTPGQAEAGNYKKGHVTLHGLNISIENPVGSVRRSLRGAAEPWEVVMQHHYGYIKGTVGRDKDHVDAYIGPKPQATRVFVVDQVDPKTRAFDEHKVMIGFGSQEAAMEAYKSAFSDGSGEARIGAVTPMPIGTFKDWVKDHENTSKPLAYEAPAAAETARTNEEAAAEAPAPETAASKPERHAENMPHAKVGDLIADIDDQIKQGHGNADLLPTKESGPEFAEAMRGAGWSLGNDKQWHRDGWSLFVRSQGDLAPPIAQWSKDEGGAKEKKPERRKDLKQRKAVAQMSPDEMRKALLADDLTGLGNRRAWEEARAKDPKPIVASLDLDGLKWINDNMGHEHGDELIRAVGQALREEGLDAYHTSGDEFLAQFGKDDEAREALERVRDRLARSTITATLADGSEATLKGVGFSYGIGSDLETADRGLADDKSGREHAGLRAGRGEQPAGLARNAAREARVPESEARPAQAVASRRPTESKKTAPEGAVSTSEASSPLDAHDAFMERARAGDVTLGEYRHAYEAAVRDKEAIEKELQGLTKDELAKRIGGRYSSRDTKPQLVRAAYNDVLSDYSLGRAYSYTMGRGTAEDGIRTVANATTEADLSDYAKKVADLRAERSQRVERFKKALSNPETLEEFDTFAKYHKEGEKGLTAEQRARYDELRAERNKGQRAAVQERKAEVAAAGEQVGSKIVETKHTRDGHDLFVVQLDKRVEADDYKKLLTGAKKVGGWYSSFRGNGAVPGFQFKDRASAEAFQKFTQEGDTGAVKEAALERRAGLAEERKSNAAQRLTDMADKAEAKANEELGRDRLANTARRARMADSTDSKARAEVAMAKTLRNLAAAIESGDAKHLEGIRTRAQVEQLDSIARSAKADRLRAEFPSYVDQERNKDRPLDVKDAEHVKWPGEFGTNREQILDAVRALEKVPNSKRLSDQLRKLADRTANPDAQLPVPRETVEAFVDKIGERRGGPWWWKDRLAAARRLEAAGITDAPTLRAAIREYVEYRTATPVEDRVKKLERQLAGNPSIGIDYFPTPENLANRMAEALDVKSGMSVLEPSAGNGNLADAVRANTPGANIDAVEVSSNLREILEAKKYSVVAHDFDEYTPTKQYDRIIMNPPFSNGQDAAHVQRAYDMLKPGGRLVAITGEGIFFRDDAKSRDFRRWFDFVGGESEKLEGAFTDRRQVKTTGVASRMLVIDKPETGGSLSESPVFSRSSDEGKPGQGFTRHATKSGLPTFVRDDIALVKPRLAETQPLDGSQRIAYDILDPKIFKANVDEFGRERAAAKATVGQVLLDVQDGRFKKLYNIEFYPSVRGQGYGRRAVRAMLMSQNTPITIGDIQPDAVDFWAKMGAKFPRSADYMEASLDRYQYATQNRSEALRGDDGLREEGARPDAAQRSGELESGSERQQPGTAGESPERPLGRDLPDEGTQKRGANAAGTTRQQVQTWLGRPIGRMTVPVAIATDVADARALTGLDLEPDTAGIAHRGRIVLVASNIRDQLHAEQALFHEAFHVGLRRAFGKDVEGYTRALRTIAFANENVRKGAAKWSSQFGADAFERFRAEGMTDDDARSAVTTLSIEESLAEMSAARGENLELRGLRGFVEAVQKFLRAVGLTHMADWLEGMTDAGALSMIATYRDGVSRPDAQILDAASAPAYMKNRAESVEANPAFARVMPAQPSDVMDKLRTEAAHLFESPRTFNILHRTVGTQQHKASVDADFGRVFRAGQNYLQDVATLANDPADLAPHVLPMIRDLKDALRFAKVTSKADLEKVSGAVFEGTLENRVFSDDDLRQRYNLTDQQIQQYRETRAAVDRSLDQLVTTEAARMVRKENLGNAIEAAMNTPEDGAHIIADALEAQARALDEQGAERAAAAKRELALEVTQKCAKVRTLKEQGYAPLMRFGQYTVYATRDGEQLFFGMYESKRAANKAAEAMREEYPDAQVQRGVLSKEAYRLFQGLSPDTIELFGNMVTVGPNGQQVKLGETELFQQYLKLAINNRSAMKRLIARKGVAGFSEDVSRVLAQFLTSNARAASGNLHMGDMLDAVNAIPNQKGDVKDEAVKLMRYLQEPQEEASQLRGFLFVNYLGGSVASALTNMTQPIMMSFPYLAQWGTGRAAKALAEASMVTATRAKISDPELASAVQRAINDGVIAPQEIHQLQAEAMRGLTSNLHLRKGLALWGSLFSLAEQFNRKATFIAAYRIAKAEGMADPFTFAEDAVKETQGIYNRGNRPNWARGAIGATLFTFKQFSIAYIEFLKRLPPKQQALALAILVLAAGGQGLPFAEDIDDVIDTIAQALGYSWNTKQAKRQWLASVLGDGFSDFVLHGASALPGVPLDVQGRLGLGNLVPGSAIFKRSEADKSKDLLEAVGPIGSAAQSIAQGLASIEHGDFKGALGKAAPTAIQNAIKGIEMSQMGMYRDQKGRKVMDTDAWDAFIKTVGFQPAKVAAESRRMQEAQQNVGLAKEVEGEIADKWAQGLFEKDLSKVQEATAELAKWNMTNPGTPIAIKPAQIQQRVRQMAMTREQRTVKATPRELRSEVRQELQR